MSNILKQEEYTQPLSLIVNGAMNNKKIGIQQSPNTPFYKVKRIEFDTKIPYLIIDDSNDTRVDLDKVFSSKFI